ncbi:ABC transporter ATP-binding protein [Saccharopolyspora hattusasensis]|uniref:ABC transporter ATP-binding protein n=1 Tax=Saccharopolyspora hattusasensis TaxID=1128679 RepID=UPI003D95BFD9
MTGLSASIAPAAIEIRSLHHKYDGVTALHDVSLDVRPGEFLTLLGPSGSGKSSILHILAGLVEPTEGSILLDGEDITSRPPQRRDISLVFQNYALFPHMTAQENIRFPLQMRKSGQAETAARVEEILELVQLTSLRSRRPEQLSGGQQQRVAVGRAIAATPRVLLLDEPLGALDRKLRQQLGRQIRSVQRETGITAIYVTHDQEEAFTMSDRIVVMDQGSVRQVGTPEEIYLEPRDAFVAGFVGEVNLVPVTLQEISSGRVKVHTDSSAIFEASIANSEQPKGPAVVAVRPERVSVWARESSPPAGVQAIGAGRVMSSDFLGSCRQVVVESDIGPVRVLEYGDAPARRSGDEVTFGWRATDARVVEADVTAPSEGRTLELAG